MKEIRIGNAGIGPDCPVYIIAEAGSNHNGRISQAKKMIEEAADAGADAVKFQIFRAESLYSRFTPSFDYLKGDNAQTLLKKLELPREWIPELSDYCTTHDLQFLATPFDTEAVDLIDDYVPAFKVASFEIVDLELLASIARKRKPVILSTGMASLGEIEDAVMAIQSAGTDEIVLLHCNSVYPSPPDIVNLRAISTLQKVFDMPVGFSDHTLGTHIPLAAVAMGACVLEKHFTMSRTLQGPDHAFALEPRELKTMIRSVREIEQAFGTGIKSRSEQENEEMFCKARRSVHAGCNIQKGTVITRNMLVVKRPGYGILPKLLPLLVGRTAKRDILKDEWIDWTSV